MITCQCLNRIREVIKQYHPEAQLSDSSYVYTMSGVQPAPMWFTIPKGKRREKKFLLIRYCSQCGKPSSLLTSSDIATDKKTWKE